MLALLPLIIQSAAPMTMTEVRFKDCMTAALADPASGVVAANDWRIAGGGYLARGCEGFAHAEALDFRLAEASFVAAATEAETAKDERAARFWAQAGNAALAGGDPLGGVSHFSAALVQGKLTGLAQGEVHLDRARAYVALGKYPEAKADLAAAHRLAPQDPLGWLLSATLARRTDDLKTAAADIATAARLAGGDPAVALEAGNIAFAAGDMKQAKAYWEQAVAIDKTSAPAQAAQIYLGKLAGVDQAASPPR